MRSPAFAFAFVFAVAFSGYAFADPQPLTRADCEKASMTWNDSANVCGSSQDATDPRQPPVHDIAAPLSVRMTNDNNLPPRPSR